MTKETRRTFKIQLIRDVVSTSCDGLSVRETESITAQIQWDTPDGQPPKKNRGYQTCGDWRVIE